MPRRLVKRRTTDNDLDDDKSGDDDDDDGDFGRVAACIVVDWRDSSFLVFWRVNEDDTGIIVVVVAHFIFFFDFVGATTKAKDEEATVDDTAGMALGFVANRDAAPNVVVVVDVVVAVGLVAVAIVLPARDGATGQSGRIADCGWLRALS